jgi:hypothetical protein
MKHSDIFQKQVYVTDMLSKFTSEIKVLSPIKILDHTCGFVIFERDGHKQAVETKSFISTYIRACGYKLKNGYTYELSDTLPLSLKKIKC